MDSALTLLLAGVLGSELLLVHLIGLCPALAVSRKLETAAGLAISNIVVAPIAGVASFFALSLLPTTTAKALLALPIIVSCILVTLYAVATIGEHLWQQAHDWLEPFLPLMTVNCTMLGIVLIVLVDSADIGRVFLHAFGLALGYGILLVTFAQLRERIAAADVPRSFRDAPVALLSLAIMGMAVSAISGPV